MLSQYDFLKTSALAHDSDDCLLWPHSCRPKGYGQVFLGNINGKAITRRAHRVAYELVNGPIPDGLLVRHTCDTPGCYNPRHLVTGTAKDNTRDGIERGRINLKGEGNNSAKLNEGQVREIRNRYATEPGKVMAKYNRLAEMFGVGPTCIQSVVERRTWKST